MNFEAVFKLLVEKFQSEKIDFALIGGFALHASGLSRATKDIDFIVAEKDIVKVKKIMFSLGYELIHQSKDVSNYLGKLVELGKVDFLHAHRKYALAMLKRANENTIMQGKFKVRVITAEDLIGLKVQSSSNDPKRYNQDMAGIESLIKINYNSLDFPLLREYFALFNREKELDQILLKVKNAQ